MDFNFDKRRQYLIFFVFMKVIVSIFLIFLGLFTQERLPNEVKLALSGGGARGFAHIGVIQALEDYGIMINEIAGSSSGALIGAMYAGGYDIDSIYQLFKAFLNSDNLFSSFGRNDIPIDQRLNNIDYIFDVGIEDFQPVIPSALTDDSRLNFFLIRFLSPINIACNSDYSQLKIPLTIISSDLFKMKEIRFKKGDLAKVVRSSISIPTALAPVEIEDYYLVDGGVYNNLPSNVFSEDDYVIAVNTASDSYTNKSEIKDILDFSAHMINVLAAKSDSNSIKNWDLFIQPPLGANKATDWENLDSIVRIGYKHTEKLLIEKGYQKTKTHRKTSNIESIDNLPIRSVQLNGLFRLNKSVVQNHLGINPNELFSWENLENGMNRLYALKLINYFWCEVFKNNDNTLSLIIHIKENILTRLGINAYYADNLGNNIKYDIRFIGRLGFGEMINFTHYIGNFRKGAQLSFQYNNILKIPMFDILDFGINSFNYKPYKNNILDFNEFYILNKTGFETSRNMMMFFELSFKRSNYTVRNFLNSESPKNKLFSSYSMSANYIIDNIDDIKFPSHGTRLSAKGNLSFNRTEDSLKTTEHQLNQYQIIFENYHSNSSKNFIFYQIYDFSFSITDEQKDIDIFNKNSKYLSYAGEGYFDIDFYHLNYAKLDLAYKIRIFKNYYFFNRYILFTSWKDFNDIYKSNLTNIKILKGVDFGLEYQSFLGPMKLSFSKDNYFDWVSRFSIGYIF